MANNLYFSIRTKDEDTVNQILSKQSQVEFDGLNVLQDILKIGQIVFLVFGGDKPAWDTGLVGLGVLSKEPYDIGYSGRNFKVKVDVKVLLDKAIKREDLLPYRDAYGTIGIGPITKWEPNQALSQVPEKNAIALFRAMLELSPGTVTEIESFLSNDEIMLAKEATVKMLQVPVEYGQSDSDALRQFHEGDTRSEELEYNTGLEVGFQRNRIIFGAPGTGKSFTLNKEKTELLGVNNERDYERVTFHPDYSYASFVGTYKPVPDIDENGGHIITYKYVPGPFMRVYVRALKNAQTGNAKPFLLIIEEINRADVAAVFGDIFQLLDRDDDGVSEYPIQASEDIKKYLASELGGQPEDYDKIRIPDNMLIWATMNSADQGVFPMDTAFKRRWDFTYIGINDNEEDIVGKTVSLGRDGLEHRIEWNKLRKAINNYLARQKINEDKQLGPYFIARKIAVPTDGDEIDAERFTETFKSKVIMYLYEDAAKQKRSSLFQGCFPTNTRYSDICKEFDDKGIGIFNYEIMHEAAPEDIKGNIIDTDSYWGRVTE